MGRLVAVEHCSYNYQHVYLQTCVLQLRIILYFLELVLICDNYCN